MGESYVTRSIRESLLRYQWMHNRDWTEMSRYRWLGGQPDLDRIANAIDLVPGETEAELGVGG